jgi:formylglycine-generating enzyme required for sulfatase activity
MPNPKTYILDDLPTDTDALDFKPYVETLVDVCKTASTPLTIGVFGTWGSGKTSLMRMVQKGLPDNFTVAWFDAWKYDKEESLWRAFLLCILTALKKSAKGKGEPTEEFEKMETLLYRELEIEKVGGVTIDLAKLGGKVAQGLAQLSLSFIPGISTLTKLVEELQSGAASSATDEALGAIQRERTKIYIEHVRFLEQFHGKFTDLIEQHILPNRLVVFVDDLDRCLPEKAIEVLEAIKLFVDAPGCVFMLGLDQDIIARGIEMKYRELGENKDAEGKGQFTIQGIRYLEKIIQLPFYILPADRSDMGDFVQGLTADWPHAECPKVFAAGLGDNPRQIKRTVNVFLMLWNLAEKRQERLLGRIKPIRLAKVVAIQSVYPDLYNLLLKEEPRYLRALEEYYRLELSHELGPEKEKTENQKISQVEVPPAIAPFLSQRGAAAVRRVLTLHSGDVQDANFTGLPPDELKLYFTLARLAEPPGPIKRANTSDHFVFEPQMVQIPTGKFLMGSTLEQLSHAANTLEKAWTNSEQPQREVILSEYWIGKYPITNREYQHFIRNTGHKPPRGWEGNQYPPEKGDHPVTNVSWNDAAAYCEWLISETGKNYHLPTEAEWEKAARGTDGRTWPWGSKFDSNKANTKEANIGTTTPVGQFSPQGDSIYGCADMIGNVWEWCNDKLEYDSSSNISNYSHLSQQENNYIVRGGSFYRSSWDARCATRRANRSTLVGEAKGFRVALSSNIAFDA